MPNNDLNTNEVIVNGQVIMSTRNDTVTPQTLVKDETATNKEGAKIVGELDPVSHNEAYLIDDPEGDIDDSDYIPFNDVSDEEQPKKKTLFSSIVAKIKGAIGKFYNLDNSPYDGVIPANADLNYYRKAGSNYGQTIPAVGTYYCNSENAKTLLHCPVDNAFKLKIDVLSGTCCRQTITIVDNLDNRGSVYTRLFVQGVQVERWTDWETIGFKNESFTYDKATMLVSTDDLNNLNAVGTYYWIYSESETGWNPVNIPEEDAGFMYHLYIGRDNGHPLYRQIVFNPSNDNIFERTYNGTSWGNWLNLISVSKVHTYEVGINIPNNTDLDTYKTAGVYRVVDDASATTITHLPLALCGKVVVFNNGNGGFEQFYFPNHNPKIYVRTWWNNAWSSWKEIGEGGDSKDHTYEMGTEIPANSDLDDYDTEGVYYIGSNYSTIDNKPEDNTSGKLLVTISKHNPFSSSDEKGLMYNQFLISGRGLYVRWKFSYGNVWNNWTRYPWKEELYLLDDGTEIPDNSDLNNYCYTTGTYSFYGDTSTISHCPTTKAFKLVVDFLGGRSIRQTLFECAKVNNDVDLKIYTRVRTTGIQVHSWSSWAEIGTSDSKTHTYEVGTDIPANSDLNTYITEGVYRIAPNSVAETVANMPIINSGKNAGKLIVMIGVASASSGRNYVQQIFTDHYYANVYIRNTRDGGTTWEDWKLLGSQVLDAKGCVDIPANSDLNSYTSFGVYKYSAGNASTIINRPLSSNEAIVLWVMRSWDDNYVRQIAFMRNTQRIATRTYHDGTTWEEWKGLAYQDDISPSTVGNGYAVATVSGSAITATISGFKLRAGVIVALKMSHYVGTACTLNINNTGAKQILALNNSQISEGYPIVGGYALYTFMYDGTNYRILSWDATPSTAQQDYVADTSGNIVVNWGYDVNRAQIKYGLSTNKLSWNYYKNSAWRGDVKIADYDDLGASVAKVGKSILPSWGYTTNVRTANGITYTFNPATGEVTANGTATADAYCLIAGASTVYYSVTKGQYVITGCPSGGSETKYKLFFQLLMKGSTSLSTFNDYGNGCNVNLDRDGSSQFDTNNNPASWGIVIRNGQTVSNLVFKPMLRPAFTTAEYEPCEDIHKGNCYVGTCTTAGATKDKVAYVDGYFVLRKGVRVAIKFSNTNTYSSTTSSPVTLNVNNTGAKNIWYNSTHSGAGNTGTGSYIYGEAGKYFYFVYDGTYWIWDGRTTDSNSTNFLRNDASSIAKVNDASPYITLKSSVVDITQSNNGVSSTSYPAFIIEDKNGKCLSRLESIVETGGNVATFLQVRNYKSDGTNPNGGIKVFMNKNGAIWYAISSAENFNTALGHGWGTCTTAAATTEKAVTLTNYNLIKNGIVVVRFDNDVPASATMNINSKGAKPIYHHGSVIKAGVIKGGDRALFIYDGAQYLLVAIDRTDYIFKNYSYNNSAGKPTEVTIDDTNIQLPQFHYYVKGDMVMVSFIIKFVSAKNYGASNVKLFHGLYAPKQHVFCESQGKSFYLDTSGNFYIRGLSQSVTAGQTLWGITLTYIR